MPPPVLLAYATSALALSATLLWLGQRRGPAELAGWLAAYAAVAVIWCRARDQGPLGAGALALVLGFVRTWRPGFNVDLGLGLIALAVGLWMMEARASERRPALDLAEVSLLAVAVWSLLSLAFAVARVRAFVPAPGFEYRSYQFNPLGYSSDEALIRTTLGAASSFLWFGLFRYARRAELRRTTLNGVVFAVLLSNTAALLVQRFVRADFLVPAGVAAGERLNGLTSFCWALGDAALAVYLLLPMWGIARGRGVLLTAASLTMLVFAAVASGSRTSLAVMVLAAVLWIISRGLQLSRARRGRAAVGVVVAAALLVGAVAVAYRLTPADRRTPLGRLKDGVEREGLGGHLLSQRLASYPLLARVLREYPLCGVGIGLYPAEVSKQHALLTPDLQLEEWFLLASFAPNQFLNTGVELGVPAMLALGAVFGQVGWTAWRRRGASPDLLISVAVLAAALQLGPTLLNSEALVFAWLALGAAAHTPTEDAVESAPPSWRRVGVAATAAVLAAVVVLGLAGHLLSWRALSVGQQWQKLRWRLGMGMLPAERDGRWSRPEATFSTDKIVPAITVRWHAGDAAAPGYLAEVEFFVDGVLVEHRSARSGAVQETVLPLPAVNGFKRVSVRVSPPFVPAAFGAGDDRRSLGVFIHSDSGPRPPE